VIVVPCLVLALVTGAGAMAAFSARALTWGTAIKGVLFLLPAVAVLLVDLAVLPIGRGDEDPGNLTFRFFPFGPLVLATFLVSLLFGARAGIRAADEYK
jgi:hypothetical protein